MLKLYLYLVPLILAVATVKAQQNRDGDLDSVIKEIFGQPNGELNQPAVTDNPTPPAFQNNNGGGLNIDEIFTSPPPNAGFTTVPTVTVSTNPDEEETCTTEAGESGVCVTYYQCNRQNNTIVSDGTDLIDIRYGDGTCASYLHTCCLLPNRKPVDVTPPPPPVQRQGCGWRNPNGVAMKIKGDKDGESQFAEFPWMVAILKIEPVNANSPDGQKLNVYVGGGSLIHPSAVLTAAHYVAKPNIRFRARAGEWDTQTKFEPYPYQDRDVREVIIHKDFNGGNLYYDIALLILESPMDPAPNVATICLPPPQEKVRAGVRCFASGWGRDLFGKDGRYQVILKKVEVPVVDRNTCQNALRKTRLGRYFLLHSSFMCAGGEPGKDTCRGDGGSPLVCPIESEEGRYMQSGIVAWGIGCGEDGTPGVYVDVGNLRGWIDDQLPGRGISVDSYTY